MKVVALISGGKDSCYNVLQCVRHGHTIVALANLRPAPEGGKEELDSFMYQTVGAEAIGMYADAMNLPLFRRDITGGSVNVDLEYSQTQTDEVEDLYELLREVKEIMPEVEGVSVGAILSTYQRTRVEDVCLRLGMTSLAYLWQRDQHELLKDMLDHGISAVLIKVAAWGLKPVHLGQTLNALYPTICKLHEQYQLHVCGEGGEYETFVLDCPLFAKRLRVEHSEPVILSADRDAPVAYLRLLKVGLEEKPDDVMEAHRALAAERAVPPFDDSQPSKELEVLICSQHNDAPSQPITWNHQPPPPNPPTQPHMCVRDGFVFVEGVHAISPGTGSVTEETANAVDQFSATLSSVGAQCSHVLRTHLYLSSMDDFAKVNPIYKPLFGINPPSRVCVAAYSLPDHARVQLHCIGLVGDGTFRKALHVQGVSTWAPANIGPYSQAVRAGPLLFIAGQIPLDPGNMQIPTTNPLAQSRLALKHVQSVLDVHGVNLSHVICGVCYVTDASIIPHARVALAEALSKAFPVLYVVIPALPRGALVEWEFTADAEMETGRWTVGSRTHLTPTLNVDTQWMCHRQRTLKALYVTVSAPASSNEIDLEDCVSHVIGQAGAALSSMGLHWSNVTAIRWLHPKELPPIPLLAATSQSLEEMHCKTPAVGAVCVGGFGDGVCLAACMWATSTPEQPESDSEEDM